MLTFKVVSTEIYNEMVKELLESVMEFLSCRYKSSFVRCVTLLYECCQVKSYLELSDDNYAENVSINVKSIKAYVNESIYYRVINLLMEVRNNLDHGVCSNKVLDYCRSLMRDDTFKSFLEKMEFPVEIIDMFATEGSLNFCTCGLIQDKNLKRMNIFS